MERDERVLSDRRKALEEEFFRKQNEKLREEMRAKRDRENARKELAEAFPHARPEMRDRFVDEGLDAEAVSALALVPCVMVAWADGEVGDKEREAVLAAAREHGLEPGTKPHTLLSGWLGEQPSSSLIDLWAHYVEAVLSGLGPEERERLRERVVTLARDVARATGGFLGIKKISAAEEAILLRIEEAFRR
jgi:hypothetical protein